MGGNGVWARGDFVRILSETFPTPLILAATVTDAALDPPAQHDRTLLVLSVLAQSKQALNAAQLGEATGLAKSTLYRQLALLRRWGFVMESGGLYSPGPVSVQLARGFDGNSELIQAARRDMQALAAQSHESVGLVVAVNERLVCLEMVDSAQSLRCSFDKGRGVALRDGASAKCLLAHLQPEQRDAHLSRMFQDPVERQSRATELDAIAQAGYAVTSGEVDAGVWGASAPLLGAGRQLRGGLTLMAPLSRVLGMEAALVHMTVVTAARISRALGPR